MRGIANIVGGLATSGIGSAGDVLHKTGSGADEYSWVPLIDILGGGIINGTSSVTVPTTSENVEYNAGPGFLHNFEVNSLPVGNWSDIALSIGTLLSVVNGEQSSNLATVRATDSGYNSSVMQLSANKASNTDFNFLECVSEAGTADEIEFKVDGAGRMHSNSPIIALGADYAEAFEWVDGNPNGEDRTGMAVSLNSEGKIEESVDPFFTLGVISANANFIGNACSTHWTNKYLKDDFGRYITPNGYKRLSPDWDAEKAYIPRLERPEWDAVGVLGQIPVRKFQVVSSTWTLIREISNNVNLYWVK